MLNHISKLSLIFVFAIAMIVTSCEKEGIDELTENFTPDTALAATLVTANARSGDQNQQAENRGNNGNRRGSCFDLVYPLTIAFPDGTTAEATDQDALKELKQAWKEANPDAEERPSLVFPIQIDQDGEITDIADAEALREAKQACRGDKGSRGRDRGGRKNKCFQVVYPVKLVLLDGSTVTVEDRTGKRTAIQAWKEANPDAEDGAKATIGFPLTVELTDETQMTLSSEEELAALKETCLVDAEENGSN